MVVPISKPTNMSEPSNYQPISLPCTLGKLLEKHNIILEHLVDYKLKLSSRQWGFSFNRSTVSALVSVTHDWLLL